MDTWLCILSVAFFSLTHLHICSVLWISQERGLCDEPVAVQLLCHVRLCDLLGCSTPGFTVLCYLPEFAQIHVHWDSDAIQSSHPLSPSSPLAFSVFQHVRVFSNESALCISWSKYWSFSFSIHPSHEYSALISFRIYCFDLLQSKESSPAPQFENINSSALSLQVWIWGI